MGSVVKVNSAPSHQHREWKAILTWGAYSTKDQVLTLSESIKNFSWIAIRCGYDTDSTAGGGASITPLPYAYLAGESFTPMVSITYALNGTWYKGTLKFTDDTHVMLFSATNSITLRTIYGIR